MTDLATHRREEYQGSLMACADNEAAAAVSGEWSRTTGGRDAGKDADSSRGASRHGFHGLEGCSVMGAGTAPHGVWLPALGTVS